VGVTACVPPPVASAKVLPSLPVTTTWVALIAVTVNIDEAPEMIDAGLAVIPLVGATGAVLNWLPTHPVNSMKSKVQGISVKKILLDDLRVSNFVTVSSFLSLTGECRPG